MSKHIHIIGGGIIGLTSAWYLTELGYEVILIDKDDLTDGTSYGNAGMIVPSHFIPMAAPGVISQGMKWMFSSSSPFYVKPRLSLELVQWLWTFYRHCNSRHVERSMPVLYEFNEWSKTLYRDFANSNRFSFCFEEKGLLMLYKTKHAQREELELAGKAYDLGVEVQDLNVQQLRKLEPDTTLDVLGGIYFPGDAHLYPNLFLAGLKEQLKERGVRFLDNFKVQNFIAAAGTINGLIASDGRKERVNSVVLCGGSWTPSLLRKLGIKMLLQDGKGYSFTLDQPIKRPRIPTILTEAKVAVTPMGKDLRIGGTLELGGMSSTVNRSRLRGIVDSVPEYYPEISIKADDLRRIWMGYRPCSPDGLPFIGRPRGMDNLIVATGHGMMGMSMGPATGKLVSELVTNVSTTINVTPFSLNR